jgi:hypothetical protein
LGLLGLKSKHVLLPCLGIVPPPLLKVELGGEKAASRFSMELHLLDPRCVMLIGLRIKREDDERVGDVWKRREKGKKSKFKTISCLSTYCT